MNAKRIPSLLVLSALLLLGNAHADTDASACKPAWSEGWIRWIPASGTGMQAGYGKLRNDCTQPMVVVAASSTMYGHVSLHETVQVDGVSRMREVERLEIVPGKEVSLQPGGLHLMLMQASSALRLEQKVPLRLLLSDGSELDIELQVRRTAP